MNKKNALIVGAVVLFIGLYQFLVLAPHQQKVREWEAFQRGQQTATQSTGETLPADPAQVVNTTSAPQKNPANPVAGNSSTETVELKDRKSIYELSVGSNRHLQIYEGAYLGAAELKDYFVRGIEEKEPVVLNEKGVFWSSNNAGIQSCLNSLKQDSLVQGNSNMVLMKATAGGGSCEFSLAPDETHPGLLTMKLVVDGFQSSSTDVIRLQGQGILGSTIQVDQNYLSYKLDKSISNVRGKDLFEFEAQSGTVDWMTWGDRYFSLIIKPEGAYNPNLSHKALSNNPNADDKTSAVEYAFEYPARPELSKSRFEFANKVYFGSRDTSILNEIDPQLVETVDLGFFASVARIMLWSLKALNRIFDNFGISIIALTLLVRIVFWPLNKKAYMSTIKLKDIQPDMERVKKKYDSKDRSQAEQMNREIFALYKTKKVNPLGGCLPMLLQLPIFIGLYGALNHSVDLYQAPFFGWLTDLSLPDPFFILPIVWTVSLLGYLAVNPQAMNTNQPGMPNMKWMMIGMNVFFGFLSKDWPAGLLVYLVVSNCVGLGQQYFLMRSNTKPQLAKEGA